MPTHISYINSILNIAINCRGYILKEIQGEEQQQ